MKLTAKQIREIREKLGFSQEELASRVGVWRETVNRWERGRGVPHHIFVEKLRQLERAG